MEDPPIILFITSKQCGHCTAFRGIDGKPSRDRQWNYTYIRNLLNFLPRNGQQLKPKALSIIEINVSTMGNNIDNISELNIYTCIPSLREIHDEIERSKKDNFKFFDTKIINGTAVERISIKRGTFDSVSIEVEVDGEFTPWLTDFYINEYIWELTPIAVQMVRLCLLSKKQFPSELVSKIEDINIQNFIKNNYASCLNNINVFDQQLITHHFNFKWLLSKIFVNKIRTYENFYPCWMLVSPIEWRSCLDDRNRNIYARMVGRITELHGGRYETTPYSSGETIESLLTSYHEKKVSLTYDVDESGKRRIFSWQKR